MQNNVKVIAVFSALVISVLIYFFVFDDADKANSKYISSDWNTIAGPMDLEPNGFGICSNLLLKKHHVSVLKMVKTVDSLKGNPSDGSLYLVMGDKVAFLEKEWTQIRSAVEQGASLFVCTNRLSGNLAEDLLQNKSLRFSYSESVTTGFFNDQKRSMGYKIYQNDTLAQKWYFIDKEALEDPLTFVNQPEFAGCARFRLGKGQVILSLNTDLLRNYQLNRPEWRQYVHRVLSEIPSSKRIYWLSFGLLGDNENTSGQGQGQGEMEDNSLLKLFFANRILTMALLLITIGILLFILFRIRRRRPIVALPLKERHHASEFTRTVTSIFINRRNPYGILQIQRKNFYMVVQRYYYMDISKLDSDRDRSIALLSEKSGVDKEFIVRILQLLETKVRINVTDSYLFDVYDRIQNFYQKAGIQQYNEHRILRESAEIRRGLTLVLLLIGAGLILFVSGLWLLTMAQSVGALLFIGAFVMLMGGFRMMSLPIISWTEDELLLYSKGISKRTFLWRDLISVESDANVVTWRFSNNGYVQLRWSEISRFDHGRLQRLIEIKSKNN